MPALQDSGLWNFKLFHQIVVCPGCQTKNRLAYNKPLPACGKCKGSLAEAKAVAPPTFRAPRFVPSTKDGEHFMQNLADGHRCFARGIFAEANRCYQSAIQTAFSGSIPERGELDQLMGEAYYYKGMSHFLEGEYAEAVKAFKVGIKPMRFVPEAYLWLLASLEHTETLLQEANFLLTVFGTMTPPSVRKTLAPRYNPEGLADDPANGARFVHACFQDDPELLQALASATASAPA